MNPSMLGGYVPGGGVLHRIAPRSKLLCLLLALTAVLLADSLWRYLLVLAALGALLRLSGLPFRQTAGGILRLWPFFLTVFLMNAMFSGGEQVIFKLWLLRVTHEGIARGISVVFNVVLCMILGNLLLRTTTPTAITKGISWLISPLRFLGIPVDDIAIILSVAIQFVPTLSREITTLRMAQTARGARFESKKLSHRIVSYGALVTPLFLSAFRRADELSTAMEARGYRGGSRRSRPPRTPFVTSDICALSLCVLLLILLLLLP